MSTICSFVEYHVLHPQVRDVEIEAAVQQAIATPVAGICVPPYWVKKAGRDTTPAGVSLLTVIGFPLGYQRTEAKVTEMELAFADGAQEVILVVNLSAIKSQRWNWIKAEMARFAKAVHDREHLLTVLTDVALLSEAEKNRLCKDAADAGADYFQIATGTLPNPVPVESVSLVRQMLHPSVGLKVFMKQASVPQLSQLVEAGAERVCLADIACLCEK